MCFSGRPDPEQSAVQQQPRSTRRASTSGSIALFETIFSIVRRRSRPTRVQLFDFYYFSTKAILILQTFQGFVFTPLALRSIVLIIFFLLFIWFVSYKLGSPPDRHRRCIATSPSRARHSRPSEMPALLSYSCCVAGFIASQQKFYERLVVASRPFCRRGDSRSAVVTFLCTCLPLWNRS